MTHIPAHSPTSLSPLCIPTYRFPSPALTPNLTYNSPYLSTGSAYQLLNGSHTSFPSNPQSASALVSAQSNVASQITGTPHENNGYGDKIFTGTNTGIGLSAGKLARLGRAGGRLGHLEVLGGLGPATGIVGGVYALPKDIGTAGKAIGEAWRSGSGQDWIHAGAETARASSTGLTLARNTLDAPLWLHNYRTGKAAKAAFQTAAPNASKAVVKAAVEQASKEALGRGGNAAGHAVKEAANKAALKSGTTVAKATGTTGRTAARAALNKGGKAAAKAATKAAGKGLLKAGAKAGARFVPGLNVAVAAADSAAMVATLADDKASTGKKVTSVITAAGSIVAATNIPVVSQVGPAVSAVSSFISSWF